jgi:hypothetical protein
MLTIVTMMMGAASAQECSPAALELDARALAQGSSLFVMARDAEQARVASAGGLRVGTVPWGDPLAYVWGPHGSAHELGTREAVDPHLLDPSELLGISGIPVMIEGEQDVAVVAGTLEANPTPYPHPVPVLDVAVQRSGWTVSETGDTLVGVAPLPWVVDGVPVEGVGFWIFGDEVVGVLGLPVVEDRRGTRTEACDAHLVLGDDLR